MSCFKHISFLFPVQKKRLEVNVGESEIYCLSLQILENQGNTVLLKTLMIPSLSNETNRNEF